MSLTHAAIKAAKPRQKPYRMFDGKGLYLEVAPSGGRWWRFKYRYGGKERRLSLGVFPDTSLSDARELLAEARKLLGNGIDPSVERKQAKLALNESTANTFEAIAQEWFDSRKGAWSPSHSEKVIGRLKNHVYRTLGKRGIRTITGPEVVALAKGIAAKSPDTARRVLQVMGQVFRYAMRSHRADHDPTHKLFEILPARDSDRRHFAAITEPQAVGALLRAIDGFEGQYVTRCALKLAPLLFVRPGELRHAEWTEIDLEAAEWRIPAAKMKMRREHRVPLSKPAIAILRELQAVTGRGRYVFPSLRTTAKPMSENTLNAALRRMGYAQSEMCAHGFRSLASTNLHELGYASHVIEAQLAHVDSNEVRKAYNQAEHWPERKQMMQKWAVYLEGLRSGAKVTPIGKRRA
ncbi:MAG: tyrosine-type recombinase/integrase [Gammaproteobacteria bacterium]